MGRKVINWKYLGYNKRVCKALACFLEFILLFELIGFQHFSFMLVTLKLDDIRLCPSSQNCIGLTEKRCMQNLFYLKTINHKITSRPVYSLYAFLNKFIKILKKNIQQFVTPNSLRDNTYYHLFSYLGFSSQKQKVFRCDEQ